MTTSVVFVKDHVATTTTTLMYTQEQKNGVLKFWQDTDPLLINLQHQPSFFGRVRLADLDPYHFRILLALNLGLLGDLSNEQKLDPKNLTMRALDWTLMGLLNCLESRSQSLVSAMTVNRVTVENILVDVSLSMEPIKMPKPKPRGPKLRVLVDNERG